MPACFQPIYRSQSFLSMLTIAWLQVRVHGEVFCCNLLSSLDRADVVRRCRIQLCGRLRGFYATAASVWYGPVGDY